MARAAPAACPPAPRRGATACLLLVRCCYQNGPTIRRRAHEMSAKVGLHGSRYRKRNRYDRRRPSWGPYRPAGRRPKRAGNVASPGPPRPAGRAPVRRECLAGLGLWSPPQQGRGAAPVNGVVGAAGASHGGWVPAPPAPRHCMALRAMSRQTRLDGIARLGADALSRSTRRRAPGSGGATGRRQRTWDGDRGRVEAWAAVESQSLCVGTDF
jgi:hypothetical protein